MVPRGRCGEYDIEVKITLLAPEEGGRTKGLRSEFWSQHFVIDGMECMAYFKLKDREILNPGETTGVFVVFAWPEFLKGRLHPDKPFALHEAYHLIGKVHIVSMLNFEKHVEESLRGKENA